jgi:hypothetical protein
MMDIVDNNIRNYKDQVRPIGDGILYSSAVGYASGRKGGYMRNDRGRRSERFLPNR